MLVLRSPLDFLIDVFVKTDGKRLRRSFMNCVLIRYPAAEDRPLTKGE